MRWRVVLLLSYCSFISANIIERHRVRREESIDGTAGIPAASTDKVEVKAILDELPTTAKDEIAVTLSPADIFNITQVERIIDVCDEESAPGRHMIYCKGRLLEAVNSLQLFKDSKTFVDRPIKENNTGEAIMEEFNEQFPGAIADLNADAVRAFVEAHFDEEGHELDACELTDWSESPKSFATIADPEMHSFALKLNEIWKELCRRVKPVVKEDSERFSLLYVANNFIAPGGRFREFYYWDTYWIIKGLLASGMVETTRGMIENFASIVQQYGFIPNGGRVYYLKRSQPPLLTPMVYEYYQATRNETFVREMLPVLEREYEFWAKQRSVTVQMGEKNHTMYQYRTDANVPRPESYREDLATAQDFPSEGRKQLLYKDLGSAAESGWDFSTRWFADKKTLLSIHTTDIVPVDLNAYMCYNQHIMSFLHGEIGNVNKQRSWMEQYMTFRSAFQQVFYVHGAKGWYDYDLRNATHNTEFYPSIAVPLFAGCYESLSLSQSDDLYNHMADMGAFNYVGGVPTSLAEGAQEQWDFPNGWAPLNHMLIEGLRKTDNPRLQQKAFYLAQKWIRSNYHVWKVDRAMWEKYNVASGEPRTGGGGEYDVQAGFGWTNGAILDLLLTYGDRMADGGEDIVTVPPQKQEGTTTTITAGVNSSPLLTSPLLLVASIVSLFIMQYL